MLCLPGQIEVTCLSLKQAKDSEIVSTQIYKCLQEGSKERVYHWLQVNQAWPGSLSVPLKLIFLILIGHLWAVLRNCTSEFRSFGKDCLRALCCAFVLILSQAETSMAPVKKNHQWWCCRMSHRVLDTSSCRWWMRTTAWSQELPRAVRMNYSSPSVHDLYDSTTATAKTDPGTTLDVTVPETATISPETTSFNSTKIPDVASTGPGLSTMLLSFGIITVIGLAVAMVRESC